MGDVLVRESATFPVLEPFVADLVAADVKVPDFLWNSPQANRAGLRRAVTLSGVRFVGVSARSHHDLDFRDVGELRRYTLVEKGKFFPRRRLLGVLPSRDTGAFLEPPESKRPQWLIVGSPVHGAHVFSADFHPSADSYSVGLLTGFTGADQPVFQFTFQKSPTNELFLLEHIATNVSTVLETLELPIVAEKNARQHVRLMCDATNGWELRMYRNGALVLIHHPESEPRGASGRHRQRAGHDRRFWRRLHHDLGFGRLDAPAGRLGSHGRPPELATVGRL